MLDFTNCKINNYKFYGGKNGGKICIIYNDEDYMLKFPAINEGIEEYGYSNSCVSEYIACNIVKTLGLNVQDTILGTFNLNGIDKIVVACKDFTSSGNVLKQFAELKNSQIETSKNGYGTELTEVIETIENQLIYDVKELKEFFWNMFIVDSLVGNFDRHNGNWGFLINESLKKIEIAPIYDCASCLYPQLTDDRIEQIINDDDELKARVFVFPTSALKMNDKKINYFEFISSLTNSDCNKALLKIFPKIDIEKINKIIDETPFISEIRKEFYKKILKMRYEKILKFSYEKLCK
ncbi:MAG: HipA domain-containing protein [Clostridia bacterium]|nr:HipA domain-containing protein [Clostridia bacterium]